LADSRGWLAAYRELPSRANFLDRAARRQPLEAVSDLMFGFPGESEARNQVLMDLRHGRGPLLQKLKQLGDPQDVVVQQREQHTAVLCFSKSLPLRRENEPFAVEFDQTHRIQNRP